MFNRPLTHTNKKIIMVTSAVVAVTIGLWIVALVLFRSHPGFLPTLVVTYILGLRHAMDADHIAAIDNVTRKLVGSCKYPPVCIGLFFSLGHSTVVVRFLS